MLLRDALGETLRDARTRQNRTLRDVSTAANVSLGYLSEVERGRKEASSELLASICDALDLELAEVLDTVSETIRLDTAPVRADLAVNALKTQNRRPIPYAVDPTRPGKAASDKAMGDKATTGGRHLVPRPTAASAPQRLRIVLPYERSEAGVN